MFFRDIFPTNGADSSRICRYLEVEGMGVSVWLELEVFENHIEPVNIQQFSKRPQNIIRLR